MIALAFLLPQITTAQTLPSRELQFLTGGSSDFQDIEIISADEAWAVGHEISYLQNGLWTRHPASVLLQDPNCEARQLNALDFNSSGMGIAVGQDRTLLSYAPGIGWQNLPSTVEEPGDFHDVWLSEEGEIWAAGAGLWHWKAGQWREALAGDFLRIYSFKDQLLLLQSQALLGLDVSGVNDIWQAAPGSNVDLKDLSIDAENRIWLVGYEGFIQVLENGEWQTVTQTPDWKINRAEHDSLGRLWLGLSIPNGRPNLVLHDGGFWKVLSPGCFHCPQPTMEADRSSSRPSSTDAGLTSVDSDGVKALAFSKDTELGWIADSSRLVHLLENRLGVYLSEKDSFHDLAISSPGQMLAIGGSLQGQFHYFDFPNHHRISSLEEGAISTGIALEQDEYFLAGDQFTGRLIEGSWLPDGGNVVNVVGLEQGEDDTIYAAGWYDEEIYPLLYKFDPAGRQTLYESSETGNLMVDVHWDPKSKRLLAVGTKGRVVHGEELSLEHLTISDAGSLTDIVLNGGRYYINGTGGLIQFNPEDQSHRWVEPPQSQPDNPERDLKLLDIQEVNGAFWALFQAGQSVELHQYTGMEWTQVQSNICFDRSEGLHIRHDSRWPDRLFFLGRRGSIASLNLGTAPRENPLFLPVVSKPSWEDS